MTQIKNEITINGKMEDIWEALNQVDVLEVYDPTVSTSVATSSIKSGIGASRKVEMKDGKNWFKEKCTVSEPGKELKFELYACSFPVKNLSHTYTFEQDGSTIKVKQNMQYNMKYGFLGKLMDALMVKSKSDKGIKQFLSGLKQYIEKD